MERPCQTSSLVKAGALFISALFLVFVFDR
jgi:hypothetical protein